ncbi:LPS export ABC transporter periplasmic protein LptC [Sansalvadorimonas sp. 2012CJ34-2]|uniref:Lipopolysaccharide export system protein LptC n=1 Tax=Parendozoicomonas callyspongiae TaxID=2942213 RepID=A0ABT0PCE3_9GAMM|nr:LPS export ABC transporter periplasmic protein LptC [Sansalvadorimonas sp. 2012CJ34-2]MCL6268891.1 LPS export ABC transporter periplasmic protein LptC [Sansalvadorimonas sp. 2012CJ34-2]
MSLRQMLFTACLVLFVSAVGYWSYTADNPQEIIKPLNSVADKAPDFFTRNTKMREYGPNGRLESTLDSVEISHFPHNGVTLLTEPDMWSYQEDDILPWHSTAKNGRILPDGETVELIKDVVMIQVAPDGSAEQRIDTDFLTVYSGQDFADTDAPARLTNATSVVNTVGMRAFYKRDFIQLKSKVRSIHESR